MKKSDIKKIYILFKRDWQLIKKFLISIFITSMIVLTIVLNLNFSEEYTKYLIVFAILLSLLLSNTFLVPQSSVQLEKNGVFKSLKSFPVSNTHIFLSKLIFFFFSLFVFYLIPMFLISIIGKVPELITPFLSLNAYLTYAIGLVFIFFTIGIINLIISFVNRKFISYVFNILIILIATSGRIPTVTKFGDNIDSKIFGESFMVNGFLKFSILMFLMIIPLVYLGIKLVNSKRIYKLYEK